MNHSKKICHLITRLDRGGAPETVCEVARELAGMGYDVTLVSGPTTAWREGMQEELAESGVRLVFLKWLKRDIDPLADLKAIWELLVFFKESRFDVVHTHTAKAGVLGRIAAWVWGVPVIMHSPHGHNFYGYFSPFVSRMVLIGEKLLSCLCTRVIVLSEKEKRDYIRLKVAGEKKLTVIPNGVDPENFKDIEDAGRQLRAELEIPFEAPVVSMIGRLDPIKDPVTFIRAMPLVLRDVEECYFLIAGDGELTQGLKQMVERMNLSRRVVFTGFREDVPAIVGASSAVVITSLNEGFGISATEAMAGGRPVVATNVGGLPEIVQDGRTGLLVPPRNPEQLSRAVVSVLKNDETRERMGRAGRERVEKFYTKRRMFDSIASLYRRVALMLVLAFLAGGTDVSGGPADAPAPVHVVIHVHSKWSNGKFSLAEIADLAEERGIDAVIVTDHLALDFEYGVPPFRRIFRHRIREKSIRSSGIASYVAEFDMVNKTHQRAVMIPGAEVTPYYFWESGGVNPAARNLSKHLLVVRSEDPGRFLRSLVPGKQLFWRISEFGKLWPVFLIILGIALVSHEWKKRSVPLRGFGAVLTALSLMVLIDDMPFYHEAYSPYEKDAAFAPYQQFINKVKSGNGLVFWAHPLAWMETGYMLATARTDPYPRAISGTIDHDGFAALWEGFESVATAGGIWDNVLMDYCQGLRQRPCWAIGEADYHYEGEADKRLEDVQTVCLAREKSAGAIIEAMGSGGMYALRTEGGCTLRLEEFSCSSPGWKTAFMGQELKTAGAVTVTVRLQGEEADFTDCSAELIKGGKVVFSRSGPECRSLEFQDTLEPREKTYYRLNVMGKGLPRIIANPVFVSQQNAAK